MTNSDPTEHNDSKWVHPEDAANPLSRLMVAWVAPLIHLASERSITEEDVWPVPDSQTVEHDSKMVWNNWLEEKKFATSENREARLLYSIWNGFKWNICTSGGYQFLFMVFQLGQPYLVGELGEERSYQVHYF